MQAMDPARYLALPSPTENTMARTPAVARYRRAFGTNRQDLSAWTQALHEGAVAGTTASVLSTLALLALGRRHGSPAAPLNAVSHWLWDEEALHADRPTWRHTLVGYLTQHAASVLWATLYARVVGHRDEAKQLPNALAGGIALSAVAYVVDYTVTPKRLTPGYEHRLDGPDMFAVYAALAAGFALGAVALQRGR
jgi:hypothetical protein